MTVMMNILILSCILWMLSLTYMCVYDVYLKHKTNKKDTCCTRHNNKTRIL
jgi:hypothetical protein